MVQVPKEIPKQGPVIVVDYGMGNIHSIIKALRLYLPDVRYSNDIKEIQNAIALVLPGDGAFGAAMQALSGPLVTAITQSMHAGKAILGICIGFQVLFQDSDESPAKHTNASSPIISGLGFIPGHIRRFPFTDGTRIPHIGWNQLVIEKEKKIEGFMTSVSLHQQHAYFIHSWRAQGVPPEHVVAWCDYAGDTFPAIVTYKNTTAFQFHPEKSGQWGLQLIQKWAESIS